jgi:hypothetical protein
VIKMAVVRNIASLYFLEVSQGGHDREPDEDTRTLSREQKSAPELNPVRAKPWMAPVLGRECLGT